MFNPINLRVVVVDDEPEVLRTLGRILMKRGCEVFPFQSPLAALDFLKKQGADLIFSDLKMPEMDGIQFLHEAKSLRPAPPFILITGFASISTAVSAIQWGAAEYIQKPFDIKKIYDVMDKVLNQGGGAS